MPFKKEEEEEDLAPEQPLGYAQAKKRRRILELEEQLKKIMEEQAAATAAAASMVAEIPAIPEYAQGLASINSSATPAVVTTQSYVAPSTSNSISITTASQTPTTLSTPTTPPTVLPVVVSSTVTASVENTLVAVQTVRPAQTVTQIQTTAHSRNYELMNQIKIIDMKINNLTHIIRKIFNKIDELCKSQENQKKRRKNRINESEYSCSCNSKNCSSYVCGCKKRRINCTALCSCRYKVCKNEKSKKTDSEESD